MTKKWHCHHVIQDALKLLKCAFFKHTGSGGGSGFSLQRLVTKEHSAIKQNPPLELLFPGTQEFSISVFLSIFPRV